MPAKVILKFTKGGLKDKAFCYDQKDSVIIGRLSDSNIVVPESDSTVSRYHCILDINPPIVTVRDFGSLNGTYLNGQKIGQGDIHLSVEERREKKSEEFALKQGDCLGLANVCELVMNVVLPQYCADCFCDIDQVVHTNTERQPVCADCHAKADQRMQAEQAALLAKAQAERDRIDALARAEALKKIEKEAKDKAEQERIAEERKEAQRLADEAAEMARKKEELIKQKKADEEAEHIRKKAQQEARNNPKCDICGVALPTNGPKICATCRNNPEKLLDYLLLQALKEGGGSAQQVAGYRDIRMLGQGGMGAVWLVEELKTGQLMAMKLMLPDAAADEKRTALFLREAYFACQLQHQNIVQHYKCGRSGDIFFILLEYCRGGSVDDFIKRNGTIFDPALNLMACRTREEKKELERRMMERIKMASHIILQTLDGLAYASCVPVVAKLADGREEVVNGVVHRDFKPGNIFLTDTSPYPVAKIADFGLAKSFHTAGLTDHTLTGQFAGTPVFMPRQQIINYRYAKPDVDVWAAAASYYYMLTGYAPKNFAGKKDVFQVALSEDHIPVQIRNPHIPKKLAEVVDSALRERPQIGCATATALKTAIQNVIHDL